ncbi:MAG: hypothetical protein ACREJN_21275 [Nitrospiraceae bacterium]
MPSNWTKQLQQISSAGGGHLNGGSGDEIIGGLLTGVPSGLIISQALQDIPGDRIIFGAADALAMSNISVGTLYEGLYQYVNTTSTSTAANTRGRLAFWNPELEANAYQVTPDENAFIAGVFINTITRGYSWWIQIAGQVTAAFRTGMLGTPTIGAGVYAAYQGAGANVGTLDQVSGLYSDSPSSEDVDLLITRNMGQAVALPVAGAASVVDIPLRKVHF